MTWNRKTTRRDRKQRTRRGQTARGRRARLRDIAFWCEYFKIGMRHEVDYLIRYYEAMALMHPVDTPPPAVP